MLRLSEPTRAMLLLEGSWNGLDGMLRLTVTAVAMGLFGAFCGAVKGRSEQFEKNQTVIC